MGFYDQMSNIDDNSIVRCPKSNLFYTGLSKRILDLVIVIVALPFISVVWVLLFFGIKIILRQHLIFRQNRVGMNGKVFTIYKFRTYSESGTSKNVNRVTKKIFRFIRASHIDELPQVINVLCAHMSVVGPRPYTSEECEVLTEQVPYFGLRHAVKPGLTGMAQIFYTHENSGEHALRKIHYDLEYVDKIGFIFDLRIIVKTFIELVKMRGI